MTHTASIQDTLDDARQFTTAAMHKADRGARIEVLESAHAAMFRLEQATTATVFAARACGETWTSIGRALGITKQAAQQKYGREALAGWPSHRPGATPSDPYTPIDGSTDEHGNYYETSLV